MFGLSGQNIIPKPDLHGALTVLVRYKPALQCPQNGQKYSDTLLWNLNIYIHLQNFLLTD